ncbi:hypothetical protein QP028_13995 [Corynebacterium suedekumii]|nr:hypothetical protein QP028_13995 [Corynebacterium suedekumii]
MKRDNHRAGAGTRRPRHRHRRHRRLRAAPARPLPDLTRFHRGLVSAAGGDDTTLREMIPADDLDPWLTRWLGHSPDAGRLGRIHPVYIPRNHLVEEALSAAVDGDLAPFDKLLDAVTHPLRGEARPGPLRPPGTGGLRALPHVLRHLRLSGWEIPCSHVRQPCPFQLRPPPPLFPGHPVGGHGTLPVDQGPDPGTAPGVRPPRQFLVVGCGRSHPGGR